MKNYQACAIYTRKSSEEGLDQEFNSLDAQREACEAFIVSQKSQGWTAIDTKYDDGGFSGGNTERPALQRLMADIISKHIKVLVVYKVDRLTRSLADFAKMVEMFDEHGISFVSVTQQFNTTSSMGRLTLNVLLSFAQFEREVTGERIRDKIAASKRKGMWMGGVPPIGYTPHERSLVIDEAQAKQVREIYRRYLVLGCVRRLKGELERLGWLTPIRFTRKEKQVGGKQFSRGHLYRILSNPIYIGKIVHKEKVYAGKHLAIIEMSLWHAVQEQLKKNIHNHKTRSTAAQPSLLAGLLFDEHGNKLTPSHTKKGERRYRYYISQYATDSRRSKLLPPLRVPARELERAVTDGITGLLTDEVRLLESIDVSDASLIQYRFGHGKQLAEDIAESKSPEKIMILNRIIYRITLKTHSLEIILRTKSIWLDEHIDGSDKIMIEVPVQLKRCGMAVKLIVQAPGIQPARAPDEKMLALLAKAHAWFAKLISGKYDSVQAIAQEQGVTSSYCTRIIYLAFLDPLILQRIVNGEQPVEINSEALKKVLPLPVSWDEQRKLLGMTAPAL